MRTTPQAHNCSHRSSSSTSFETVSHWPGAHQSSFCLYFSSTGVTGMSPPHQNFCIGSSDRIQVFTLVIPLTLGRVFHDVIIKVLSGADIVWRWLEMMLPLLRYVSHRACHTAHCRLQLLTMQTCPKESLCIFMTSSLPQSRRLHTATQHGSCAPLSHYE